MFSFYGCFSIFGIGLVWVGGVNLSNDQHAATPVVVL